ncbi:MAG: 5-formyltetrahydrofolate cyclo-ligase [bacterium]|nr:5-formyltetrahydrofolate cyclo-ligase [bacterium]
MSYYIKEKKAFRKQMLAARESIEPQTRSLLSKEICSRIQLMEWYRKADYIFAYAPIRSEVDMKPLIETAFSDGKRVAFPRVEKDEILFYEVNNFNELNEGSFHVPEPEKHPGNLIRVENVLVLVPGCAFSRRGARMGYGGGFYDRFFEKHSQAVRVGIAYESQLSDALEQLAEPTDQWMDGIVTEAAFYDCSQYYTREQMLHKICEGGYFAGKPGIVLSRQLLSYLGRPQEQLQFVHIAGTNGKGSVAAFLNQICIEAGISAGMYTSPHLTDFAERIRLGHEVIPDEELLALGARVLSAAKSMWLETGLFPTMSDDALAIALLYYRKKSVKFVILETGMGGRLDSTNVIPPALVSVITQIGLEHTRYLGDTLTAIANEKAGIIKNGSRAVLMRQEPEVMAVLEGVCKQRNIPWVVGDEVATEVKLGLFGAHQRKNAAVAAETAQILCEMGFDEITPDVIVRGLQKCRWPGRMELLGEAPWCMIDGAHNVSGVQALCKSLKESFKDEQFIFVMGVLADKDYRQMASEILPIAKRVYTVQPASTRALAAEELTTAIRALGGECEMLASTDRISDILNAQEKTVIFGSLSLIGEIRQRLLQIYGRSMK